MAPYTARIYPLAGGDPRVVTVLEERPDGWLALPLNTGNPDLPHRPVLLSRTEWFVGGDGARP